MGNKTSQVSAIAAAPSGESFPGASSFQTTLTVLPVGFADLVIPIPVAVNTVYQVTVMMMGREESAASAVAAVAGSRRYMIIRNLNGAITGSGAGLGGVDAGFLSAGVTLDVLDVNSVPDTAVLRVNNASDKQIKLNITVSISSFVPGYNIGS